MTAVTCASSTINGLGADACTVSLSGSAPAAGITVNLSSSSASVSMPASVTVPGGSSSAAFTAVASSSSAQSVTLKASAGGLSRTFTVQLSAATAPALSTGSTAINFGDVAVNSPSSQSLTLSSSGTAALTITGATAAGAGFSVSGLALPVTLNPGQSATLNVQFNPAAAGTDSGQVTIASNSSSNPTSVVSLSGTGTTTSASYVVDLNWDAPSSSPDPIASYNVYRSSDGGNSFQLLNSVADSQTTYADSSVQDTLAYLYRVTSVDGAGTESAPSNTTSVSIP